MFKSLLLLSMTTLFIILSINELANHWISDIYFHTNLELISTIIALIVGTLSLVRFYTRKSALFLMIGAGFLGSGILDSYHTLVTSSSFKESMPSHLYYLIPWSWLTSRSFLAIFFIGAAMHTSRESRIIVNEKHTYYVSILFLCAVFYLLSTSVLPDPFALAQYFPRIGEILPAFLFSISLIIHITKGEGKSDVFTKYLIFSSVLNIFVQYPLMVYSEAIFDVKFNIAHILKIISYLVVLIGLLESMYEIFVNEKLTAEMLAFKEKVSKEKERKKILDSFDHGITLYDENLKLLYANKAFINTFNLPGNLTNKGVSIEEISSFIKKKYKAGYDDRRIVCPDNELEKLRTGESISSQCVFDNEKVIAMKGCPLSGQYIFSYNDVTDSVNANINSQIYSEKLSEILNTSPIGVLITCPDNDSVQWINSKAVDLLGYQSSDEIISTSLSDHWTVEGPFSVIKNTPENKKLKEVQLSNKHNNKFWCYISKNKITLDKILYNIFWIYDITNEKEFKEQSFREEKLASLGRLVSGVADEINTPLGVCITAYSLIFEELEVCAYKLENQTLNKNDFKRFINISNDALSILKNNLNSTAQLIEKFKDISSLEFIEKKQVIQVDTYFKNMQINLQDYLENTNTKLILGHLTTTELSTYPCALTKVIFNLITNSIKHAFSYNEQGTIRLSTRINELNELEVCYTDNGNGIPPSIISKVMEPFFTTSNHITSNGLGLSIAHHIVVSQLKGSITLESEMGKGIEIIISIPISNQVHN
jgi:nitrogen-specific signal transduction histidine kinase